MFTAVLGGSGFANIVRKAADSITNARLLKAVVRTVTGLFAWVTALTVCVPQGRTPDVTVPETVNVPVMMNHASLRSFTHRTPPTVQSVSRPRPMARVLANAAMPKAACRAQTTSACSTARTATAPVFRSATPRRAPQFARGAFRVLTIGMPLASTAASNSTCVCQHHAKQTQTVKTISFAAYRTNSIRNILRGYCLPRQEGAARNGDPVVKTPFARVPPVCADTDTGYCSGLCDDNTDCPDGFSCGIVNFGISADPGSAPAMLCQRLSGSEDDCRTDADCGENEACSFTTDGDLENGRPVEPLIVTGKCFEKPENAVGAGEECGDENPCGVENFCLRAGGQVCATACTQALTVPTFTDSKARCALVWHLGKRQRGRLRTV